MANIREFSRVAVEVAAERVRQDARWGEQNHPDGTGLPGDIIAAELARELCDKRAADGTVAWRDILLEEVCEAFAEADAGKLRMELVQVAAVAAAWVAAIDRRGK